MTKLKQQKIPSVGKDIQQVSYSGITSGNILLYSPFGKLKLFMKNENICAPWSDDSTHR